MAWVKLDDGFMRNPKVRRAGPVAAALYVTGLCYSAGALTDGVLPKEDVPLLLAEAQVTRSAVKKLVEVGLWVEREDDYLIPDFLEFNRARSEVVADRHAARERRQRGGRTSREPSPDVQPTLPGASVTPSRPVPDEETRAPFEAEFDAAWAAYPRKVSRKAALHAWQATRRRGETAEDLALAVKHYAAECELEHREARYIKHGATFFGPSEAWRDYLTAPAFRPEVHGSGLPARQSFDRGGA